MADTAALVVALSAQLTKFEKDMQKAGIMAEKAVGDIENKFSKMNVGAGAGIGSFLGTLTGSLMSTALKELSTLYDRFKQIDETAKLAAISMNMVFGAQSALKGASFEAVDKALVSLSALLDRAQRGEAGNALSTIFSINSVALGSIKDANEALAKVADIVSRLTPIQGLQVLQKLGIDPSLLEDLRKGEVHFREIQAAAAAAAPDLQKLADQAKEFDALWKLASDNLKSYLSQAFDAAMESTRQFMRNTVAELRALESLTNSIREAFGVTGKTGMAGQLADKIEGMANEGQGGPKRIPVTGGRTTANPYPVNTGAGGEESKAFERANDQITKHIALMEADTAAVGKSVGERERLRVEAALTVAAEKQYGEVTAETTEKIRQQAEAAGNAAQRLAETSGKLQAINAASAQLGQAVSTAFTDAIAEGKKLNEVLDSLVKTLLKAALNTTIMNLFTPGAGQTASGLAKILGFAGGTNSAPGGLAMVGEKGPELVNLPRGAQVIPNDVLRNSTGGGAIVYSPAIDARGASVEAVARLAQIMEADRAAFASRTIATIQQARRGRVPGV